MILLLIIKKIKILALQLISFNVIIVWLEAKLEERRGVCNGYGMGVEWVWSGCGVGVKQKHLHKSLIKITKILKEEF